MRVSAAKGFVAEHDGRRRTVVISKAFLGIFFRKGNGRMQADTHHHIGVRHGGEQLRAFAFKFFHAAAHAPFRIARYVKQPDPAFSQTAEIIRVEL